MIRWCAFLIYFVLSIQTHYNDTKMETLNKFSGIYKALVIIVLSIFVQANVFGQTAWQLNTEKDGIKVFTQQIPDSKVKAIKVECELNATQSQLVALIMDVNTSADWVYRTKSSVLVKQVSPSELYYYSEVKMPWPTANRDFVAHLIVKQNPYTKVVTIDGPAVTGMVPEKKGIVRITNSTGKWTIIPEGFDHVKVTYTLHVEPGGSIPSWLVNMFATEGPLNVFESLKVQMQKPVYKYAELPYIDSKQYAQNTNY
jgi:hypothetical protein